ncbi:MAG TPA: hypothetical protein VN598_13610 [Usitatibacter sp.]|nr:hypothetical protein [Usitatibacter sp.]
MGTGTRKVYCFYTYDCGSGRMVHSPRAATMDTIEKLDGVPLKESVLEVDERDVDSCGYLRGPGHCDHPSHRAIDP